jgi:capsular exopolysaccharide synthesis family protein
LRSNLLSALGEAERPVLLVTSSHSGEGKTSVAANLAVSLAQSGKAVGLVDFDLRRPSLHEWFGIDNELGATDVLLGRRHLDECLHHLHVGGLAGDGTVLLLTAGLAVEQPTELLSTGRPSTLLRELGGSAARPVRTTRPPADVIVIDTPPVLPIADSLVLGKLATGVLLVLETGKTASVAARQAKDALIRSQARLLGVVMNSRSSGVSNAEDLGYSFGYGYGYGYEPGRSAR